MSKSRRGFSVFLLVCASIIALSNPSAAAEQHLFEKVLTISNWHVHASRHFFNAAGAGEARIKISKNSPDGEIQQGFFVLNGALTFIGDFLAGDERVFEKDVTVQADNTLLIFLLGTPGTAISCQIIADEALPPAPEITAFTAEPPSIKRGQSATLSWQTVNADSCVIEPGVGAVDPGGSVSVAPTDTTTYTLTAEGTGDPATATVTVTVENSAPVAEPQMVTTDEDTAASISLSASDIDGDSLTFTITAGPQKGILSGTAPLLTYTPDENYHGPDSFSFKANDGRTDSNTAAVSLQINAVNDAPLAQAGPDRNVFVGDQVILDGSASSDVDQDTLAFNWSVAVRPAGSSAELSDPSIVNPTFIPDIAGTYEIQLIVKDGKVESVPDKVGIYTEARKVAVPNVAGAAQSAAQAAILSAGLAVGAVTFEHSATVAQGNVISQNPAAGTSVVENSAVDLIISLGSGNQPPAVSFNVLPPSIPQGGTAILTWSSLRAQKAHIDNDMGSVPLEGTAQVSPQSTTTYTITVTGPAGSASARVTVYVMGNPEPQPEGSYGEQYEDLVPPDATVDQYDPRRFSLITGSVRTIDQLPLPGVGITIHSRAEYGSVVTDAEGRFSIPVEGGGTLTVVYQKQGLIPAQRKVYVPWNDNAIVEPVVMITEDPVATTLTFDGNAETVVTHKSQEVVDEDGTRAVTMVFSGDNKAYLVDEQGNDVQQLTTITTRATEYPIPESMPARLPPNSAFTYCAELSVEGVQRVRFDKPVTTFIDNFLGFPTGSIVPVGYYDRDKGAWVPSENGVVVELLDADTDGAVDALDADGDGQPDDLDEDGTYSSEVKGLDDSQRYVPGATFWRVQMTHFTPFDCNWPSGPPQDAIASNASGFTQADTQIDNGTDPKRHICSFVEEKSRIFHEDISIPGTDIMLHYASNRVAGYKPGLLTVPASGDTVPQSLIRIDVLVDIAGKQYRVELPPSPNQTAEIQWDGLDHLGRPLSGAVAAHVRVGFVYYGVYYLPSPVGQAFGQPGVGTVEIDSREEIVLWKEFAIPIIRGKGTIAEGWTLSPHHQVSPLDPSTIIKGDGTVNKNNVVIIDTYAGNGQAGFDNLDGPATEANIGSIHDVETDPAGNLYIGTGELVGYHSWDYRVLKVDIDGIVTPEVNLPRGSAFDIDAQGNFYNPDSAQSCIFKLNPDGSSTRVAGICDPNYYGFSGDGGPAVSARLYYPSGIDLDQEGNLYIADGNNHRIRKVDVNGIITTVAGSGPIGSSGGGFSGDGGLATEALLKRPSDVAIDKAGNLFIADGSGRIRKVDASGIISTVAGNGSSLYAGDGVPATETGIYSVGKVEVDSAGNLYLVSPTAHRVWKVDTSSIITTVAGSGPFNLGAFEGDGGPATAARLYYPYDVAVDAAGNIFIADSQNYRIRRVSPPSARLAGAMGESNIAFAEENGVGYIMSSSGLHRKTIDLNTGISLLEFGYDEENNLVSITDQFDEQITIERDANDVPTAIIAPDGIRTQLTIDANNHLTRIAYPDGSHYQFEYSPNGLLTLKTQPEGNQFGHVFDANGRITDFTDDESGHWRFSRTVQEDGQVLHETLTGEGNLTSYLDRDFSTGAFESTITDPTGTATLITRSEDGLLETVSLPCGVERELKYNIDEQYASKYIEEIDENMPSGLHRATTHNRTYTDSDEDGIADIIAYTVTVNGKSSVRQQNILQATVSQTSPEGRVIAQLYDPATLATESVSISGLHDTAFGYDTRGRITSITANTRQTTLSYTDDQNSHQVTITDSEQHQWIYYSDAMDRLRWIQRPDGSQVQFTYDNNGNMTVLTNPLDISHGFGYSDVNLNSSYTPPLSGSYSHLYDKDRRLIRTDFPSGRQIFNIYDSTRLSQIQTPEGNIDFTYLCGMKIGSITWGAESITYGYDGILLTSETQAGTLNQSLSYTYNNDFDVSSLTYAGQATAYSYDNDGLMTAAGNFTVTRNAANGLPEAVAGGALGTVRSFNGYGEADGQTATVNSQNVGSWSLVRDANGRIIGKTETVAGVAHDYIYGYDSTGRLLTVTRDSTLVEQYDYDANGTRIYEMNTLRGIAGRTYSYDDEDYLLTAGSVTYVYDLDGFLTAKTDGSDVTGYTYSSRGELLSVNLPDGRIVEYVHDPLERRIAKKINGTIVEKYLWQGMTRLLAVYDGANNLLMRFEYADDRMPVALTAGGATYYLTYDQVGSLSVVADSVGVVIKRIDYDSFGNIIAETNPAFGLPFGFAGGLHDRDTGLVRFGYRDYDPDVGRWTAKDPIGFAGGDTDLYGYVLNNPINLIDPEGLLVTYWGVGASAGLGPPKEGDSVNMLVASGVVYEGSNRSGGSEKGVAGTIGAGRIGGAAAGAGLIAGFHIGDVEDLSGRATAAGVTIGPFSIELTFNMDMSWTGVNFGFMKSFGLGAYGIETITGRFPYASSAPCD